LVGLQSPGTSGGGGGDGLSGSSGGDGGVPGGSIEHSTQFEHRLDLKSHLAITEQFAVSGQ